MLQLTRTALGLPLAMPLFGAQMVGSQVIRSRFGHDKAGREAGVGIADEMQSFLQLGEGLGQGMMDLTLAVADPRTAVRLGVDFAQRSSEAFRLFFPGRNVGPALTEIVNKAEVFLLVKENRRILGIPSTDPLPLLELVGRAYELDPFPALWAVEGLGHEYGASFWRQEIVPEGILTEEALADLPDKSLLMLHAGIGLSFAQHLLQDLSSSTPSAEIQRVVARIIELCHANSRSGYVGAALESIGLVTRTFHPKLVPAVDRAFREVAAEAVGYYWHGVGRAIYFLPPNFLPCSDWRTFETARRESPDELARRNAFAGLAWAFVMVNQRQPGILADLLIAPHGEELARDDAFSNGVASSIIMRVDTTPEAAFIAAFNEFQPDDARAALVDRWNRLVRLPAEKAVNVFHPILKARDQLGTVFQYQDFSAMINRDLDEDD